MRRVKMGLHQDIDIRLINHPPLETKYHFTLKVSARKRIDPCCLVTKLFLTRKDIN